MSTTTACTVSAVSCCCCCVADVHHDDVLTYSCCCCSYCCQLPLNMQANSNQHCMQQQLPLESMMLSVANLSWLCGPHVSPPLLLRSFSYCYCSCKPILLNTVRGCRTVLLRMPPCPAANPILHILPLMVLPLLLPGAANHAKVPITCTMPLSSS